MKVSELEVKYKLSEFDRGWLSALIDGEGTICISRTSSRSAAHTYSYQLGVKIANTSFDLLCRAKAICFGEGNIRLDTPRYSRGATKDCFTYNLPSSLFKVILPQLDLIAKAQLLSIALEFINISSVGRSHSPKARSYLIVQQQEELYQKAKSQR